MRISRIFHIIGEESVACLANPFRGSASLEAIDAAITAAKPQQAPTLLQFPRLQPLPQPRKGAPDSDTTS
jgi:hypothetical protein